MMKGFDMDRDILELATIDPWSVNIPHPYFSSKEKAGGIFEK